jgi:hypothetical protein
VVDPGLGAALAYATGWLGALSLHLCVLISHAGGLVLHLVWHMLMWRIVFLLYGGFTFTCRGVDAALGAALAYASRGLVR